MNTDFSGGWYRYTTFEQPAVPGLMASCKHCKGFETCLVALDPFSVMISRNKLVLFLISRKVRIVLLNCLPDGRSVFHTNLL